MVRAKLSLEAARPDPNLRLIIGHLNVLEPLMLELSDAEVKHQKCFDRYANGVTKPTESHTLQVDIVAEELAGKDSFADGDQFNTPVISKLQQPDSIHDLTRDAARLELIQTSLSNSQPLLAIATRMFAAEGIKRQVRPPNNKAWYRGVQRASYPV
ncbi:uncharacterized protein VDAG_09166 [Verticillium dahliae VdLs.17]|uniref:Uncharacterized protein n=1 Tax=Verticillium dahliae (strain VdLs.17 / ATCC MYA-4575 / FGSC 10137) TaxID=498257 RepID=G2XFP2_VERDV|nr:uncharacterized protein VDAG_09166 [Verticillium dahliae VdLs.17]EGY18640.1 hypothetical protein VDAG_09166 [Verticillium dahliae VdLs.17]